ncbi:disks large homolog 5-like [Peromyscus maniculatus bairdii]|uniref:disks large homolog 5-like n=1 Tax=Peromyscus maniculatus bairdii TaxID=230844 RepID=UPI003FD30271
MMTNERNELLELLALYNNNELNNRLKSELEMLKTQHKKMSDIKKFSKEICEASYKCKELNEQTNSYRTLYSQLLSEWTRLMEKVSMLKEDNRKLHGEQILLQESCEEARRHCEEAHEKIYDLWTKQQQHLLRSLIRLEEARDTLEGMTFYTPGSRRPQKMPPLFSFELNSEANINLPSGDPATISSTAVGSLSPEESLYQK